MPNAIHRQMAETERREKSDHKASTRNSRFPHLPVLSPVEKPVKRRTSFGQHLIIESACEHCVNEPLV